MRGSSRAWAPLNQQRDAAKKIYPRSSWAESVALGGWHPDARASRDILKRSLLLYRELTVDDRRRNFDDDFIARWREMPLAVWAKAEGTSQAWFTLEADQLTSRPQVADEDHDTFAAMTDEMVQLRLREHIDRLRGRFPAQDAGAPIRLRVSHAGNRRILRLDRDRRGDTPERDVSVIVDGESYTFWFRKVAVNKAVAEEGGPNLLPRLLRGWHGLAAGLPGTRHWSTTLVS